MNVDCRAEGYYLYESVEILGVEHLQNNVHYRTKPSGNCLFLFASVWWNTKRQKDRVRERERAEETA